MKTTIISSIVSLAIGFTFGWLIKTASSEHDDIVPPPLTNTSPQKPDRADTTAPVRDRTDRDSPNIDTMDRLPRGTADVPESAKHLDRAKWKRLIEVLGLDTDQSKALDAAIAESLPKTDTGKSPDAAYMEAGERLEKKILALLGEEQKSAFLDLQQRSMKNKIEISAQKTFADELGELDLSSEQREKALDLLRQREEQSASEITPATRLLLTGSFLPIGDEKFSEDSIRLLRQISPQDTGDMHLDKLAERRRNEADQKAELFGSVLTPAQLEIYRSRAYLTPDLLDQIRSRQ